MRKTVSLNGDAWRTAPSDLRSADIARLPSHSIPATVPGEVRLDLIRAGQLSGDPFYGRNNEKSRWVEEHDWWTWRDFDLKLAAGERAWLILHGADYYSSTY